ncbi:hypothetical protein [Halocynthiibacter sp.]|uniref:hypothetical protein n=1 Tax=Halocynthiibacter sp. TaxID=1979210 RepID=UPI003C383F0D
MGIVIYMLAGFAGIAVFYLLARGYSLRVALIVLLISNLAVVVIAGILSMAEDSMYISGSAYFVVLMILLAAPLSLAGVTGICLAWWANRKESRAQP